MKKLPIEIIEEITKYLNFWQVINLPWINVDIIKCIHKRGNNEYQPVMAAPVYYGYYITVFKADNLKVFKLLLKAEIFFKSIYRIDSELYKNTQQHILQHAAKYNSINVLKYVLDNNIININKYTCYEAVFENNLEMLKIIYSYYEAHKASIENFIDNAFWFCGARSLIDIACCSHNNHEMVLFLFNTKDSDLARFTDLTRDYYQKKAFNYMNENGSLETQELITKVGLTLGIYPIEIKLTINNRDKANYKQWL